jgi:hypothetical protein
LRNGRRDWDFYSNWSLNIFIWTLGGVERSLLLNAICIVFGMEKKGKGIDGVHK